MTEQTPRLRLAGISKHFGAVQANNDIALEVAPGEIHCLLGENGAGKSTLMNILYGLVRPDAGAIFLDGKPATIRSPHQAIELGIGMVHQHFMLVPTLTVAENVILATRPLLSLRRLGESVIRDRRAIERQVGEVAQRYGLKIDPAARVSALSVGEQQRVEIVKALYRGVKLLILDEPTAVLTPQETSDLFKTLRDFTAAGLSIILITHKLHEVMAISDRVTVLRDGKVVGRRVTRQTDTHELAELMVGRDVRLTVEKRAAQPGAPALVVEALTVLGAHGRRLLDQLSLQVAAGEVLGVAGVDGNGQRELALAITGILRPDSGSITVEGKALTGAMPRQIADASVRHIPEDRQQMGLILDFSAADNFVLKQFSRLPFTRRGLLQPATILAHAQRLIRAFDVRTPSPALPVANLSGGNQQKVVLGREIDSNPRVLVAAQPTRGLDVGATEYVHKALIAQRDAGAAILLISTELEEVLALSDRIVVLYEGRIVGEVPGDRANTQKIGLMMAGVQAALQPVERWGTNTNEA
ncbi:MAG: ABC transporter ATP-binding protein [Caldilineaceae bacterium]|nr:ABC transporter ATP-binding protein [Caldilineaceae bacterium]